MRKDAALDGLAKHGNVAQFLSFRPGQAGELVATYSRVRGCSPNHSFASPREGIEVLLALSSEKRVNIRSFQPEDPRSREFIYGLRTVDAALEAAERLAREGLFVILNETVDVADGGVSGVIHGDIIEFAPDDTPRCVEKPGVCSLPVAWGLSILERVYGVVPEAPEHGRLEFSLHPRRRGYAHAHVLAWEFEEVPAPETLPRVSWPNRFSRLIGDKAFGLLMACELGLRVPRTHVVSRRIAPFEFGAATGSRECWIRTCPTEPQPGLYTTAKGWMDPFALLNQEDPSGGTIASVLRQDAVEASYSGAAIVGSNDELFIEGVRGEGSNFMLGDDPPMVLPERIRADVAAVYHSARKQLGPVRFEWVHDGDYVWVVQLHVGSTETSQMQLVPGDAARWVRFAADSGLTALRDILQDLPDDTGLIIEGEVGLTSHIADLVRKAMRPARIRPQP